jgi:hypothetical protein
MSAAQKRRYSPEYKALVEAEIAQKREVKAKKTEEMKEARIQRAEERAKNRAERKAVKKRLLLLGLLFAFLLKTSSGGLLQERLVP